jgi:queuosine precursor transporter
MKTKHVSIATLYLATIPLANWFINNVGNQAAPGLPHTIPVGFGYQAPSGVLFIGFALFARDLMQEELGKRRIVYLIAVGIALSYLVNPAVATASAIAFACGELVDLLIYTKIRKRNQVLAVLCSGVVGSAVDSILFLQIAFGSVMFWQGQVIGKVMITCLCALIVWVKNALSDRVHSL